MPAVALPLAPGSTAPAAARAEPVPADHGFARLIAPDDPDPPLLRRSPLGTSEALAELAGLLGQAVAAATGRLAAAEAQDRASDGTVQQVLATVTEAIAALLHRFDPAGATMAALLQPGDPPMETALPAPRQAAAAIGAVAAEVLQIMEGKEPSAIARPAAMAAVLAELAAAGAARTETASATPAPAPDFTASLRQQISARSLSEGTTRFALNPEGLGALEIEIGRNEAGGLRLVLRAESPAVLAALRNDRDGLLALLRTSGAVTGDPALSFEELAAPQQPARPGRSRDGERAGSPAARSRRSGRGRLDILT